MRKRRIEIQKENKIFKMELSEENNQILNEINASLEYIYLMLQSPKLFICNYFSNLKTELDTYFAQNQSINETNQWTYLIKKIERYEQEYYKNCSLTETFKEKIKLEIKFIQTKISYAKLNKVTKLYYEQLKELTDCTEYKTEKVLLSNRTFIFLNNFLNRFDSKKSSLLLIVNDEYVRKKQLIYFNSEMNLIRLSNEMTKTILLFGEICGTANLENSLFLEINLNIIGVKELFLNRFQINCLEDDAFEGFDNIEDLYLDHNLLTCINQTAFINLNKLEKLDLSNNLIDSIDQYDFFYLKQITYLSLSYNKIETIQVDTFEQLINLKFLNLNGNLLTEIESFTFKDLIKLEKLLLKGNKITRLGNKSFETLIQLKHLDLMFNDISPCLDIKCFFGLKNLKELAFARNQIFKVEPNDSNELSNLNWLDLSGNSILEIKNNTFGGLKSLDSLYLSHNQLTVLKNFKISGNIRHLDLCNNLIIEIKIEAFKDLCSLEILKLESNKLSQINYKCFEYLKNLKELNLSYNLITSLHLKELSSLKKLKLNNNFLENIRFESLEQLKMLDISENPKIENLSELKELVNLEELIYSIDQLTKLPDLTNKNTKKILNDDE